jgi:hypothetical protein
MFLFALPFLGIGTYFTLGSLGLIPFDESKVNGPVWLVTAAGLVFFIGGLMLFGMGLEQASLLRRSEKAARQHPDEPAMADYPWDREGHSPPRWAPVRKSLVMLFFMVIFASIPNVLAYESDPTPIVLRISAIVMNLIVIGVLVYALNRLRHAIKFGRTRLRYPRFPLRPGETADLEIELPASLRQIESAHFDLRCIREKYEMQGSGKNRRKQLIQEALYESSQQIEGQALGGSAASLRVRFEIPEDQPCTAMRGKPPHYWELEMIAKVPGLDLNQRYLLPVYAAVER